MPGGDDSDGLVPRSGSAHEIELRVDRVDDLFRRFDPAPMSRRSLSGEVDEYLFGQIETHPPPENVSMRILLPASEAACCDAVQSAFRHHFSRSAEKHKDALRRHFKLGRRMLISAIVIAVALVLLIQSIAEFSEVVLVQKIANGISIVVWVTMWRPIEFLLYDWREMGRELKTYLRLSKIDVRCVSEPQIEGA